MDSETFAALRDKGTAIVASAHALRVRAMQEKQRAHELHREIAHWLRPAFVVPSPQTPALTAANVSPPARSILDDFLADADNPYDRAKELIDGYGRWARYVALERAIHRVLAGDMTGERIWRGVFEAVIELQRRRQPAQRSL